MFRFFLIVLAVLILLSLVGYAIYLWIRLKNQKALELELQKQAEEAQKERFFRIVDSVDVIARAMIVEQCDLSEGVLRLKPLLDVLGKKLSDYAAMWALYQFVEEMAILDERKNLKRNERMRQDLAREAKEAELCDEIKRECTQLLDNINHFKKAL